MNLKHLSLPLTSKTNKTRPKIHIRAKNALGIKLSRRCPVKTQKGQGLIEYIILVAIIAVASIGIVRALGQVTSAQLANITLSLQGKAGRKVDTGQVHESLYSKKDLSDFTRNSSQSANGN